MVKNQGAFRILSSVALETVKIQWEEKQKSMISGQFFLISFFSNFWQFRNKFWCQVKQVFRINYQYFRCYATFFLLKF